VILGQGSVTVGPGERCRERYTRCTADGNDGAEAAS
jgi:hypothetical protein